MKMISQIGLAFFALMSFQVYGQSPSASVEEWTTKGFVRSGGELMYLGASDNQESESSAVTMAEQDAITQMIKHYFGVKMKYSLSSTESLATVTLNINKAESSDSIELRGLVRTNVKVEKERNDSYRAWVQISISEKNLRAEKQRIEQRRQAQAVADALRVTKKEIEENKNMVPKLYLGMPRGLFMKTYPAPNSILGSYPYETFHYQGWNFCSDGFFGCYIYFVNGRLERWDSINPKFVDFSRSADR